MNEWPIVGCGKGFIPYKNGPRILNIDTGKNEYKAMMSSRLPQLLDDAVKQARHLSLADLCDNLDIDAVFRWLPMAFPFDFGYEVNANPASSLG